MNTFQRIDQIQSVSAMKNAVAELSAKERKTVILEGLKTSRFQFTWSWLAKTFQVDAEA
jgi:hypothetical protein